MCKDEITVVYYIKIGNEYAEVDKTEWLSFVDNKCITYTLRSVDQIALIAERIINY